MASVRTRVVMITLSTLLGEIIEQVVSRRLELEVVARLDRQTALCARLRLVAPDLVLIGLRPNETDAVASSILACIPAAKVIVFTSDGRHAYLHDMRARRAALLNVTPERLIEAIVGNLKGDPV
jgi:DNA-binding NarL/FixJ family response regulator